MNLSTREIDPAWKEFHAFQGDSEDRPQAASPLKDQDVSGEYRFTHVWIRRSDRWQVVASQVMRIANP
jgi:hypothetical protein